MLSTGGVSRFVSWKEQTLGNQESAPTFRGSNCLADRVGRPVCPNADKEQMVIAKDQKDGIASLVRFRSIRRFWRGTRVLQEATFLQLGGFDIVEPQIFFSIHASAASPSGHHKENKATLGLYLLFPLAG